MIPSRLEIYGIVGAVIAVFCLGVYLYIGHLQRQVKDLKTEVANVKLQADTAQKAADTTQKYVQGQVQVMRRIQNEKSQLAKEVLDVPVSDLDGLYDRYRMHPNEVRPAPANRKPAPAN